jgi:hypothetical protein
MAQNDSKRATVEKKSAVTNLDTDNSDDDDDTQVSPNVSSNSNTPATPGLRTIPRKRPLDNDSSSSTTAVRQRVNGSDGVSSSSTKVQPSSSSSSWSDFSTRAPQRGSATISTSQLVVNSHPPTPDTQALVSALDSLTPYFTSTPGVQRVPSRPNAGLYQSYQSNFTNDTSIWHDAHPPVLQFWVDGKPLLDRSCKFKLVEHAHASFHFFISLLLLSHSPLTIGCHNNSSSIQVCT